MRTVFFGTSEFAVSVLEVLRQDSRFELVMVVTQPDARSGRGQRSTPSQVKKATDEWELEEAGIPVAQFPSVNEPESVQALKELGADLFLTAAYGQKLSDEVLAIPSRYALNVHGSLLPKYRGAAPVQHAILQGEKESGVTLMGMTSRMDAGPIYAQIKTPITPDETGGSLMEKLAGLSQQLLADHFEAMAAGKLEATEQDESLACPAPSLSKEDGRVKWTETAEQIDRHVRAMTPWPSAYTFCPTDRSPARIIAVKGDVVDVPSPAMPGTIVAFTTGIEVATKKGVYRLTEVKRSGKRALSAVEFLRGFPIRVGTRLQ